MRGDILTALLETKLEPILQLVDADGENDDHTFDDHLPKFGNAEHYQTIGKHADNEGPHQRPAD